MACSKKLQDSDPTAAVAVVAVSRADGDDAFYSSCLRYAHHLQALIFEVG